MALVAKIGILGYHLKRVESVKGVWDINSWNGDIELSEIALKEKRVLKQYPWGTILENGAF